MPEGPGRRDGCYQYPRLFHQAREMEATKKTLLSSFWRGKRLACVRGLSALAEFPPAETGQIRREPRRYHPLNANSAGSAWCGLSGWKRQSPPDRAQGHAAGSGFGVKAFSKSRKTEKLSTEEKSADLTFLYLFFKFQSLEKCKALKSLRVIGVLVLENTREGPPITRTNRPR